MGEVHRNKKIELVTKIFLQAEHPWLLGIMLGVVIRRGSSVRPGRRCIYPGNLEKTGGHNVSRNLDHASLSVNLPGKLEDRPGSQ